MEHAIERGQYVNVALAREAARVIAARIVRGEVDAYVGATQIWKHVLNGMNERIPDDLWPFKSNASAIEDCLVDTADGGRHHEALLAQCRADIVDAARMLADNAPDV